jgi:hypothetical protein
MNVAAQPQIPFVPWTPTFVPVASMAVIVPNQSPGSRTRRVAPVARLRLTTT